MQKDRTARRSLALHPSDNVAQVSTPSTKPLPPAGLAALKRLEQALKAVTA